MRVVRILAVVSLLPVGALAFAQGLASKSPAVDANVLFARMLKAQDSLSYKGSAAITSYEGQKPAVTRSNVYHLAPDKSRYEYLGPDGKLILTSILLRDKVITGCGITGRWFKYNAPVSGEGTFADTELLMQNYRVKLEGFDKIAGRDAVRLKLEAVTGDRPSAILYVDRLNAFRLKQVDLTRKGAVKIDRAYESIEFVDTLDKSLFEAPKGIPITPIQPQNVSEEKRSVGEQLAAALEELGDRLVLPSRVPRGFRLSSVLYYLPTQDGAGDSFTLHLGYTDGLASVSVFCVPDAGHGATGSAAGQTRLALEPAKESKPAKGEKGAEIKPEPAKPSPPLYEKVTYEGYTVYQSMRGDETLFLRTENGWRITVVGDIDPQDLLALSTSLHPAK